MTNQTVNLDFCAPEAKYVRARLTDGTVVVWSGAKYKYHEDIHDALSQTLGKSAIQDIEGGGSVRIDQVAKTICLFGGSSIYRKEPDRSATIALIKQHYPDYTVTQEKLW